ncbi:hypothetical protein HNQ59_003476 [Chitinivorax tropicus]|uniref:DUF4845 domain-containing protein n=1 Tax=Chitinivorax tropicus TaxID=714531 RepID=A0A840MTP5_9PROT|nr:DUF4845 domain-containing protein [Chitinivorax tropicus]MBB5020162.1 hypothetical protein [Chitinivorax tropicus]
MRKQQGLSLFGFLIIAAFVGFFALLAVRSIPAYSEYFSVKKMVKALIQENASGSPQDIRNSFDKRASIDYVSSVKGEDLDITQIGGVTTIGLEYSKEVPVVANISLKFAFKIEETTGSKAAAAQ